MIKLSLFLLQLSVLIVCAHTETRAQFTFLKDTYPGVVSGGPDCFFVFQNKLYFRTADDTHGYELWVYDGSNEPYMAYDLLPGSFSSRPYNFVNYQDTLYFTAFVSSDQSHTAIWKYDGTHDPVVAAHGALPWADKLTKFQDLIFFEGHDATHGYELWTYDGVHAPSLLKDINTGNGGSFPYSFTIFHDKLYFVADDGVHGYEIWVYDGINEPSLACDINPDPHAPMTTSDLAVFQDKLYFAASTSDYGNELWMFDGTNTPTRISDINPADGSSNPAFLKVYQDSLYFSATANGLDTELWLYNGIDEPANASGNSSGSNVLGVFSLTIYHDKLYFTGSIPDYQQEVWVYDTTDKARQLSNINPNPTQSASAIYYEVYDDKLIFTADDGSTGNELWMYDDGIVTSIKEDHDAVSNLLSVYPNPSHASFTIKGKVEGDYTVYDGTGKQVLTVALNADNNYTVIIDHFKAGLYTLAGFNNKVKIAQKISVID